MSLKEELEKEEKMKQNLKNINNYYDHTTKISFIARDTILHGFIPEKTTTKPRAQSNIS